MQTHRHITWTVDDGEFEFEVQHPPATDRDGPCDPIIQKLEDGRFVVGYLCRDEDCENPLDNSDCMGVIHRRYHGSREARQAFLEAMGVDECGHDCGKANPLAVLLDVYDHSGEHWSLHGGGMQCQWDTTRGAGVWVPNEGVLEHIMYTAIQKLLPEGTRVSYESKMGPDGKCITRSPREGERPYFADGTCIDERYHNVITYTLPDGTQRGGYKNFETAIRAAARKLGIKIVRSDLMREAWKVAAECAQQAVDSYNAWGSGDCWGCVVGVFSSNGKPLGESDDCWGYIGGEYSKQSLEEAVTSKVKYLQEHPYQENDGV